MRFERYFYPQVERVIGAAWADYENRTHDDLTFQKVSKETRIAASAIHSLKKGRQKPRTETVKTLAKFFFEEDAAKQNEFIKKLGPNEIKREILPATAGKNFTFSDKENLVVGVVSYTRFATNTRSKSQKGFFNELFERFASFAALSVDWKDTTLEEAIDGLDEGRFHVVLAIMGTPDRTKRVKCFPFPFEIPVNAVVLRNRLSGRKCTDVRDALLNQFKTADPRDVIYPIVDDKEIGGLHITNFLQLRNREKDYELSEFDPEQFADRLKSKRGPALGKRAPVVVADEVTCTEVLRQLRDKGEDTAELVFGQDENQDDSGQITFQMPKYRLGFFVSLEQTRLIEYFSEAFNTFLDSNCDLVAYIYYILYSRLLGDLTSTLEKGDQSEAEKEAKAMVRNWLGFSAGGGSSNKRGKNGAITEELEEMLSRIFPNPWLRIHYKANNLISKNESDAAK